MEDCVFCKIVSGELPSTKAYEDDHASAFFDIHPAVGGHMLVVPKKHAERLELMEDSDLGPFMAAVKKVSSALQNALGADGMNTVSNSGKAAGQIIFHAHVHLLPRFENDGLAKDFKWGRKEYVQAAVDTLAQRVRQNLAKP